MLRLDMEQSTKTQHNACVVPTEITKQQKKELQWQIFKDFNLDHPVSFPFFVAQTYGDGYQCLKAICQTTCH